MPTGYTADLTTFDDYLLKCARAFGACIDQRDDNTNEPPKLRTVNKYYEDRLEELNRDLSRIKCDSRFDIASKWYSEQVSMLENHIKSANDLRVKYTAMLQEVSAWDPPTPDHFELKTFMGSQLRLSIEHDYHTSYYEEKLQKIKAMSLDEIHSKLLKDCLSDISYAAESLTKEINSVEKSNKWITALWESIK